MSSQRTYKKLGEFIEEYSVRNKSNAPIPVYSVTNDKGFCQGYFDKEVASKDKSTYKIVPRNFFAYNPSRINVGSIACQQVEDKVIVSPLYVIFGVNDEILCPYLLYFLKSPVANVYINAYARGAVRNNFSFAKMSEMKLPLPSVAEQEKIVKELDAIKEIIAAKYTQIDELDNLAKALFCSIFGDPITNPKGWPVKKLGEIAETTSGGTPSKAHKEYYEGGTIPWLRSGEVSQGLIYETELFITQIGMDNSSAKIVPVDSVAIAMYGATVGEVGIIKKPMCTNQAVCNIFPNEKYTPTYLRYFLMAMKPKYIAAAAGGAQPNISQAIIRSTMLPLPPLDLQQSFAAKIQAIEAQKQTLRQSIAEFESLLAQRMDYHFN